MPTTFNFSQDSTARVLTVYVVMAVCLTLLAISCESEASALCPGSDNAVAGGPGAADEEDDAAVENG